MPDILIRMEMPRTCVDCHDADLPTAIAWLGAKCPWAHEIIDPGVYDLLQDRHPNCPLHELPQHGDLIDRYRIPYRDTYGGLIAEKDVIDRLPTIVPAERSDTDA